MHIIDVLKQVPNDDKIWFADRVLRLMLSDEKNNASLDIEHDSDTLAEIMDEITSALPSKIFLKLSK